MAKGREEAEYNRVGLTNFILYQSFCTKFPKNKRPKVLELCDFNPFMTRRRTPSGPITAMKSLVRKRRKP